MRTVTYGAACSLDGFIAGVDGSIDWLHFSKDVQQVMTTYWKGVDAVLMGRKTWALAAPQSQATGAKRRSKDPAKEAAKPKGPATFVFSRTLEGVVAPGVELVSSDAGEFVRRMKAKPGGGICVMGGGELACALFAADVIDEVGINVHPILLGAGIPLFRDAGRRIPLDLLESRIIEGGCVLSTYRVRR